MGHIGLPIVESSPEKHLRKQSFWETKQRVSSANHLQLSDWVSWLARQLTALLYGLVFGGWVCFGRRHISHPHWRDSAKMGPQVGSKVSVLGSLPRCKWWSDQPHLKSHELMTIWKGHTTTRSLTFPRKKNTKTTMVIHCNQVNWWSSKWGVFPPPKKKSLTKRDVLCKPREADCILHFAGMGDDSLQGRTNSCST